MGCLPPQKLKIIERKICAVYLPRNWSTPNRFLQERERVEFRMHNFFLQILIFFIFKRERG